MSAFDKMPVRTMRILDLLARGMTQKQAAEYLGCTLHHVRNTMWKSRIALDVDTTAGVIWQYILWMRR